MPANARVLAAGRRLDTMQKARAAALSLGGQAQGRGVQVGPVGVQRAQRQQVQVAQARNQAAQAQNQTVQAQNNQRYEQAKAAYANKNKQQKKPGGPGGFVGDILSNPVVSTVLKPLSLLQYPKNAIIAGAQEAVKHGPDWLGAVNLPLLLIDKKKAEADKRGFLERLSDPGYGYGNIARQIDTGNDLINTWGNRAIGLGGDVALDPLSYLTAGANKIPGATGRVSLAVEAADKGLAEPVIRAAGRGGARAVRSLGDEAAVKALELPGSGVRFAGMRVPGTGRIGEGVEAALAGVRAPFTDTALGRGARKLGVARHPGTRAAVESLVGRGAETMPAEVAATLVGKTWREKAAQGAATAALENTARDIAKQGRNDATLTHALEARDLSNPVVAAWDDMNRQLLERQRAAGVSVGELADEEVGWAPRVLTKQGRQALEHETSSFGGKRGLAPGSQQYSRVIQPGGQYTIMGKVYEPVKATIEEGNAWAAKNLGKGFKLYEDSPAKLSAYAVRQAAESTGKVAGLRNIIERGLAGGAEHPAFTSVDPEATRAASKQTGGVLAEQLEPLLRDLSRSETAATRSGTALDEAGQTLRQFDREAMRAQRGAYGEAYGSANAAEAAHGAALEAAPDVSGQLEPLRAQLGEAQAAEAAAQRPVDELTKLTNSGLQGPKMTSPVISPQMAQLEEQFQRYAGLTKRFLESGDQANARQAMLRAKHTQEQLVELTRRYAIPVEGTPLPEAEPFTEALQRATGARQSLEEQLPPLEAAQAAHEAVGPPPDVDRMVAEQVQPRLDELAAARVPLTQHRAATEMADLMAEVSLATSEREFDQAIAHLPAPAQVMMKATVRADRSEPAMAKFLGDIASGKLDDQVVRQANEGFELMRTDRLMGHDIAINSEMKAAMDESDQAMRLFNEVMHKDRGLFGKVVDEYTKFFKAWALATPGQHARNAMSATFMNMSAGTTFPEMLDGNRIWAAWRRYGGGSQLSPTRRLLDRSPGAAELDWVKHLPAHLREVAPDVVSAVYASGAGGQYEAAELLQRAFGEGAEGSKVAGLLRKSYQNKFVEASHNVGEQIEGRVRSGLALHVLGRDGSGSWADAVASVKRIHFDYSDINEVDRSLRRVIPFWTFMSRNLPLQVQQMWTAPRAYSQYQSFMNNMNADPEGTMLMPDWLRRTGAVFATGGANPMAFAPDIGPSQVEAMLGKIADPKALLSDVNPLYKTPLQLATNQNFFYGDKYKENDYQQPGWETAALLPLLSALGQTQDTAQGPVVERKVLDAIRSMNPLSAQANRLFSTTADREDKGLASQLSYLGIPVRQVDQAKERKNARFDKQRAARERQDRRDALAKFGGAA